jgi:hypothetical protein
MPKNKTRTRLSVIILSGVLIALISLPSGPFYRAATITLYNTCHRFFTLCEASQGPYSHTLRMFTLHLTGPRVCSRGRSTFTRYFPLRALLPLRLIRLCVGCFFESHAPLLLTTLLRVSSSPNLDTTLRQLFPRVFTCGLAPAK